MPAESSSAGSWNGCPVCRSLGRVEGLLCVACAGTGNRRAYREIQAYRMGVAAGFAAMADAIPNCESLLTLDALQAALDATETERAWTSPDR